MGKLCSTTRGSINKARNVTHTRGMFVQFFILRLDRFEKHVFVNSFLICTNKASYEKSTIKKMYISLFTFTITLIWNSNDDYRWQVTFCAWCAFSLILNPIMLIPGWSLLQTQELPWIYLGDELWWMYGAAFGLDCPLLSRKFCSPNLMHFALQNHPYLREYKADLKNSKSFEHRKVCSLL